MQEVFNFGTESSLTEMHWQLQYYDHNACRKVCSAGEICCLQTERGI